MTSSKKQSQSNVAKRVVLGIPTAISFILIVDFIKDTYPMVNYVVIVACFVVSYIWWALSEFEEMGDGNEGKV